MKTESSSKMSSPTPKKSSKRFVFDKRYGFVYDEWRDPSEVALAYGRGMFCIVPLGKALFTMVSESVNVAASHTISVLERPDQLSPELLKANLSNQFHTLMVSIKKPHLNNFWLNGISPLHGSSNSLIKRHE